MFSFNLEKMSDDWSDSIIDEISAVMPLIFQSINDECIKNNNSSQLFSDCTINITLCDDKVSKELNSNYRGKDKPTNVLSFPLLEEIDGEYFLGDIFLSYGVIKRESLEQNKLFYNHLCHLLCHGILHLMGYDHIEKDESILMESYEVKLLERIGINNPY